MAKNFVDVMNQPRKKKGSVTLVGQESVKLTEKQKRVFDSYVQTRSIEKTSKEIDLNLWDATEVYRSKNFQTALRKYNEEMSDLVAYNSAVIIDELWKTYGSEGIGHKDKISILTLLGKHIGMWTTIVKPEDSKPTVQYNIVNYNAITGEIEKHEKEIQAELIENNDLPEGVKILTYE